MLGLCLLASQGDFTKLEKTEYVSVRITSFTAWAASTLYALMGYDAVPRLRLERKEKKSSSDYQEVKA